LQDAATKQKELDEWETNFDRLDVEAENNLTVVKSLYTITGMFKELAHQQECHRKALKSQRRTLESQASLVATVECMEDPLGETFKQLMTAKQENSELKEQIRLLEKDSEVFKDRASELEITTDLLEQELFDEKERRMDDFSTYKVRALRQNWKTLLIGLLVGQGHEVESGTCSDCENT